MQEITMLGGTRHFHVFKTDENPWSEIIIKKSLYEKKEIYRLINIKSRLFYVFEEIDNDILCDFIDALEDF